MKKFKKIYIEITNRCNLNCSFCSINKKEKKELNLAEFEHILKNIDAYTDYIYLHVKGEPLIHTNFYEILKLCKKYNKQVNITTNGSLLKYRIDDIINSNVVRQINISLQSLKTDNYLIDILNSVNKLLYNTNIQIVLRFWALENNSFTKLEEEIINNIITYFDLNRDIKNNIINEFNIKLLDRLYLNKEEKFIWPDLENDYYEEKGTCYGTRTHLGILSDGTIIPCCLDSNGIINLGNIFNSSFDDIINSDKLKNIVTSFQNNKACEELCKHCSFKEKFKKESN